jgi:ATP/maltotriose-dependent transcriptional regulator MalT
MAETIELTEPLLSRQDNRRFAIGALNAAVARALAGRTTEAIDIADRAFEARVALGDQLQLSGPGVFLVARALALAEAGQLDDAAEHARLGYDGAVEQQIRDGQAWFAVILGLISLFQGRPASAARWYREAAVIYGDMNHPAARWGHGGLAHSLALLGDIDGAEAALADLDAEPETTIRMMDPEIERGRACVMAQRGEFSVAHAVLHAAAEEARSQGMFALEAGVLHDLARFGATDRVLDRAVELSEIVDGKLMPARLQHIRALHTRGAADFDAAADLFEELGANLFAAEASAAASRAFKREGLQRRASEAGQRANRLVELCEGARTGALTAETEAIPLTRRENEVAMLAARGLSSREIAGKLFVSARTVENHLQRAYEKLGVRGRAELADAMQIEGE